MSVIGTHSYDGKCAPAKPGEFKHIPQMTFSVGVFEWVTTRSGAGIKRGPVKVRVSGPVQDAPRVYDRANQIVVELDAGHYAGPKNVKVKG